MKSHILIPKFLLKKFENEKNFFYCYDVNSGEIKKGHAKSLNTEENYYSEDTEKFLSNCIENPMSTIIKAFEKAENKKICLPNNYDSIVINYARALICRGQRIKRSVAKNSISYQFLDEQSKNNYNVNAGLYHAEKEGLFDGYSIELLLNRSDIPLVLPLCGIYECHTKYTTFLVIPVTPIYAFILIPGKSEHFKEAFSPSVHCSEVESDFVMLLNEIAFYTEIDTNKMFVVSNCQKELIRLLEKYQTKKGDESA